MVDLKSEYRHYGANVILDNTFPAAHGWESPNAVRPCGTGGSPCMVTCSINGAPYDSVRTWLTMFLGQLNPRNNGKLTGTLYTFDQTEFGGSNAFFDSWDYSNQVDPNYSLKSSLQMSVLYAMVQRVTGQP